MQNDTKDIGIHSMIQEQFVKLPPKLQEAITSTEVAEKLRALSQKHRLHLDQGQILENETYMVLLGIEKAERYEENLKKELRLSTEDAQSIANDVAKEIFLSIRNVLKESTTSSPTPKPEFMSEAPIDAPTPISMQPTHTPTQPAVHKQPTTIQHKLESVIKNESKEIKINPTKGYTVDPYREPLA